MRAIIYLLIAFSLFQFVEADELVLVTFPTQNYFLLPDEIVNITVSAGAGIVEVEFLVDGKVIGSSTEAPFYFTWDVAFYEVGPHIIRARGYNGEGQNFISSGVNIGIELITGVGIHLGLGFVPVQAHVDRIIELGANFFRDSVNWKEIETKKGTIDWKFIKYVNLKNATDQLSKARVKGCWPLVFGNGIYGNDILNSSVVRQAYGNYGRQVAEQMGNKVRVMSVWNEFFGGMGVPDHNNNGYSWDEGNGTNYYNLLSEAYPIIKKGNPDILVTGPVNVFMQNYDRNQMITLEKLGGGNFLDWVDIHTYENTAVSAARPENTVRYCISNIAQIFKKPLYISEFGYSVIQNRTQLGKAEAVARKYFAARTIPYFRGLIWYELKDSWYTPGTQEAEFGLTQRDNELTPHPAFYAYKDVASVFKRATYYGRANITSNTWLLKFRDLNGDVFVAWREENGNPILNFTFSADTSGSLSARFIASSNTTPDSTTYNFVSGDNSIQIPLTTMPQYIRFPLDTAITPSNEYQFLSTVLTEVIDVPKYSNTPNITADTNGPNASNSKLSPNMNHSSSLVIPCIILLSAFLLV